MEEFKELAHKIALQLAAMGARFISREHVPQEVIDKEKEIYAEQMKDSGKPANIIERIVESKLESFYKDNCLLEQEYVFENEKTINDLLVELIAKTGENIKVSRFVRWQVGESEN
jgi:elongation factor Ts